jgi:ABC-2 type transport system ATP-binding protein
MYLLPETTLRQRFRELLAMMDLDREEKRITIEYSRGMKREQRIRQVVTQEVE